MTTTTTRTTHGLTMRERMQIPRSRGATSGFLLIILGIWGGLVPFLGPVFGYSFTPANAWDFTWGRFWLEILPAIATIIGGLWLLGSAHRAVGSLGAWLAAAGGAWFVIGQDISRLWNNGLPAAGVPASATTVGAVAEQIGYFVGLGTVIVFLSAAALGRLSVIGHRDVLPVAAAGAPVVGTTAGAPVGTTTAGTTATPAAGTAAPATGPATGTATGPATGTAATPVEGSHAAVPPQRTGVADTPSHAETTAGTAPAAEGQPGVDSGSEWDRFRGR
ncbi:hypothetical protein [Nocardioides terrisoli]|uniref:hypothetical protein n=1 Tax=Nocardioides terrisoli TaxID=3388267 RepID=UPI00287B98BE|nr:hypothetical protein [Nocardioides marmorisolisilvae]